jgi:hypothetical protein
VLAHDTVLGTMINADDALKTEALAMKVKRPCRRHDTTGGGEKGNCYTCTNNCRSGGGGSPSPPTTVV